jgi:hypothetical protein
MVEWLYMTIRPAADSLFPSPPRGKYLASVSVRLYCGTFRVAASCFRTHAVSFHKFPTHFLLLFLCFRIIRDLHHSDYHHGVVGLYILTISYRSVMAVEAAYCIKIMIFLSIPNYFYLTSFQKSIQKRMIPVKIREEQHNK